MRVEVGRPVKTTCRGSTTGGDTWTSMLVGEEEGRWRIQNPLWWQKRQDSDGMWQWRDNGSSKLNSGCLVLVTRR
jgi:hypothetical protein